MPNDEFVRWNMYFAREAQRLEMEEARAKFRK